MCFAHDMSIFCVVCPSSVWGLLHAHKNITFMRNILMTVSSYYFLVHILLPMLLFFVPTLTIAYMLKHHNVNAWNL